MTAQDQRHALSKAGLLLSTAAGAWLTLAPVLGHMGPPWPCFVAGVAILGSLLMTWRRPEQRRGWAVLVMILAVTVLVVGTSGIPPALLGIGGGAFLVTGSSEPQSD